jgi:hypothetical protein
LMAPPHIRLTDRHRRTVCHQLPWTQVHPHRVTWLCSGTTSFAPVMHLGLISQHQVLVQLVDQ